MDQNRSTNSDLEEIDTSQGMWSSNTFIKAPLNQVENIKNIVDLNVLINFKKKKKIENTDKYKINVLNIDSLSNS